MSVLLETYKFTKKLALYRLSKPAIAGVLLLAGLLTNAHGQGRVTVQEPRKSQRTSDEDDGWGQSAPRNRNRRLAAKDQQ